MNTCILCKNQIPKSDPKEHLIPQSLGGKLQYQLLCRSCNNNLGARLYSCYKFDGMVRYAATMLQKKHPKIYKNVENRQLYTTDAPIGTKLVAKRDSNGINIIGGKQDDGSLVLPTKHAEKKIQKMIAESQENLSILKTGQSIIEVPNNQEARIDQNYVFIRWHQEKFRPDFSKNKNADPRAAVLTAFEYLYLLLGDTVLKSEFDHVRDYINNVTESPLIEVEYLRSKEPKSFHLIYPEYYNDRVTITISLFEYAVYKVTFHKMRITGAMDFVHLLDLESGEKLFANSVKEAKDHKWFTIED